MDPTVEGLAAEQRELATLLEGLPKAAWTFPTRCAGWNVGDVVLHLAQSDQLAVASLTGRFDDAAAGRLGGDGTASVDEGAAMMVEQERTTAVDALWARWSTTADQLVGLLATMELSTRVTWVAGQLSARTLATTRLAETWIHGGDIAAALGVEIVPTDRLRLIARLAWRTLPYAFQTAGLSLRGPVAFRLTSPDGAAWDLLPDGPVVTTISGPAVELCNVAARRQDAAQTSLLGEGPDAVDVLGLVRTYA